MIKYIILGLLLWFIVALIVGLVFGCMCRLNEMPGLEDIEP